MRNALVGAAVILGTSAITGSSAPGVPIKGAATMRGAIHRTASTVSGEVFDSLTNAPLADADVQVLGDGSAASFDARTDSLGRFSIDHVAAGQYLVGFFHPRIDSLGVDIPPARVRVDGNAPTTVSLAVPSRRTIISTFCPDSLSSDESTLVLGVVRDAGDGNPRPGASVSFQYSEVAFANGSLSNLRRGGIVQAQPDGRFAVCNLPLDAELVARAAIGADTSGALALRFPPIGILARDVFVASSGGASPTSTTLRGRVTTTGGRPLPYAVVTVWGVNEAAQANDSGKFEIAGVRGGSTTLDVTAPGHEAARLPIDVRTGSDHPNVVSIAMSRLPTVLAGVTVETRANPILVRSGFEERRTGGTGRFLDQKDLEKMKVITTTAALARLPGTLLRTGTRGSRLYMRDTRGRACTPTVWVDGVQYNSTAESELDAVVDIDLLAEPRSIAGVEVYARTNQAPLRFAGTSRYGCGVILIWRNDLARRPAGEKKKD